MPDELKHYAVKLHNMYIIYNKADVRIGDIYLCHGQAKYREEFYKIMNEAFEVRE